MARPRKHNIPTKVVLQAVYDATIAEQQRLQTRMDGMDRIADFHAHQQTWRDQQRASAARYSVPELFGYHLSDAECKAFQRAVTSCRDAGLVDLDGKAWIWLTDTGIAMVEGGTDAKI